MPARYSKHIRLIQAIIDFVLIGLVYILSELPIDNLKSFDLFKLGLLYTSFFLATSIYHPYKTIRTYSLFRYIRYQASFLGSQLLITMVLEFIIRVNTQSSIAFFETYASVLGVLIFYRIFYFQFFRWYRKKGYNYRNIVIVGYGKTSQDLVKTFKLHPEYGYKFLAYFSEEDFNNKQILPIKQLYQYCIDHSVDQIYCCIPFVSNKTIKQIIDFSELHHIKVNITTDFRGYLNKGFELERIENIPVLNLAYSPLELSMNRFAKRAVDFLFSGLFIITFYIPIYLIIGLFIKLESKGPVLFKQARTGLKNRVFTCLKFRTMQVNSDSETKQATQNDSRITKIGAFLRRTSMDEIPQIINVFRGEMSLVGPRPHMVKQTKRYSEIVQRFMARHYILPGMTGLAQIKGARGEIKNTRDIKNRLKYDKFYIENWSVLLDIEIVIKTIIIIIKGDEHAY